MSMKDAMLSQVTNPANDMGIERGKQFIPNNKHELYSTIARPADAKALAPLISQDDRDDIEAAYGKPLEAFLMEQCSTNRMSPIVWIKGKDTLGMSGLIKHNGSLHFWMVARDKYQFVLPYWLAEQLQSWSLLYGPLNAITSNTRNGRAMYKSLGMKITGIDAGGAVYQYEFNDKTEIQI